MLKKVSRFFRFLWKWIKRFISYLKRRDLFDILVFLFNTVVTYAYLFLSSYYSIIQTNTKASNISYYQTKIIAQASFVALALTYLREYLNNRSKRKEIKGDKIIFELVSGALENLKSINIKIKNDRKLFILEALKYIEKVTENFIENNGLENGHICANIMLKRNNPDKLDLVYITSSVGGREKITLPLEKSANIPGAPKAYFDKKMHYIEDTRSSENKKYFNSSRPYRSIISIPIKINGSIMGILNIDSTAPDQFVSEKYITQKLRPRIQPFIDMLKFVLEEQVK